MGELVEAAVDWTDDEAGVTVTQVPVNVGVGPTSTPLGLAEAEGGLTFLLTNLKKKKVNCHFQE